MSRHGATLSRFTPSVMPHDVLERLFVARERTLDTILARIEGAAESRERNHTLLVGPRGSGKTHLLALTYHRLQARRRAGLAVQLAWLPEDPWTIVSYRHLLAAVAERLEPALDEPIPKGRDELEALLSRRAEAGGPIVVLVENLDQILDALGDDGQQRLRHLLQMHRSLLLVATSTRLDRALSDHASPFYGFFTTSRLAPFDVEEAAAMLTKIAEEQGDGDLVEYLETPEAHARLRTIVHLAGGQPRIWAALATALTVRGLDDLIDLLLTRFDDLTPYYQEQLGRLSAHQRIVVAELAEVDRPINVSELAERTEIDQRSLAKTIKELVDRGWAQPTTSRFTELLDRRRTYYELAEPLARLSFQIKESRGEPLRLVVDFLKHWFDPRDFGASDAEGMVAEYLTLATHAHEHDPVVAVTRRLERLPATRAPGVGLLGDIDDALNALMRGDPEPLIRLPVPVRRALEERLGSDDALGVRIHIHDVAAAEFGHVRHPAMAGWIARAEDLVTAAGDEDATARSQLLLADWLARAWRFDEAEEVLAAARVLLATDDPRELSARASLGAAYRHAGRVKEAVETLEGVVARSKRIHGADDPRTLNARGNLAVSYQEAGRTDDAIELEERLVADSQRVLGPEDPQTLDARGNLAVSYRAAGRTRDAIELEETAVVDRERILGRDHPATLIARANLGLLYYEAGRTSEAIELAEVVLAEAERILGGTHRTTLTARANLAVFYERAGRVVDAVPVEERVLADTERIFGADHPITLKARANLAVSYSRVGQKDQATELQERIVGDSERILGPKHPDTLLARGNLAVSFGEAGRAQEAVDLQEAVVADSEEMLGRDHPRTLMARANLAASYHDAGRAEGAVHLLEDVIADCERVLGRDHPDTLTARGNLVVSYRAAGRVKEAIDLQAALVADAERVLGGDHPTTVAARAYLAALRDGGLPHRRF